MVVDERNEKGNKEQRSEQKPANPCSKLASSEFHDDDAKVLPGIPQRR